MKPKINYLPVSSIPAIRQASRSIVISSASIHAVIHKWIKSERFAFLVTMVYNEDDSDFRETGTITILKPDKFVPGKNQPYS